jgi:hypothetical protein
MQIDAITRLTLPCARLHTRTEPARLTASSVRDAAPFALWAVVLVLQADRDGKSTPNTKLAETHS